MRGKTVSFDEAISGVLFHEIATQPMAARNDEKIITLGNTK
ncbi:hypothetical protein RFEPED_0355 [Rickettsia felis str. Pedreira]|uniref:Uncharacterized protein n=1 Tax=Rickettsia felis str. Pedreira TaxID=1359196 RepID=A0A0F3MTQ6_RICFI|nr:hypothetical protein [Rickettsia felis]KJV57984.1 hypothetical protein RFEPED_0355 [Rickettsia felis str. Pedreira]MDE8611100.1 hypothetical protein [Rickettsia felis]